MSLWRPHNIQSDAFSC